ncbi:BRO-N domain-containing protein [Faecalibaculum rodentium]|uniref:BRO-N domain-containing protein n=1 Tax=Faecalibaculum rodentium TaxID=1702221 RepID=UPI0023F074BD|nr:BRO family protein [Faecalibaculum rodentium]
MEFGEVRVLQRNEDVWFVGKDVCEAFGDSNYRRSLARLDEDERGVSQISTRGGSQKMTIINESGLYSLLFQMQPAKAKGVSHNDPFIEERIQKLRRFKRWVTSEVLPAIRKTGMYAVDQLLDDPDLAIRAFTELKEERAKREALETQNAIQLQQIQDRFFQ